MDKLLLHGRNFEARMLRRFYLQIPGTGFHDNFWYNVARNARFKRAFDFAPCGARDRDNVLSQRSIP
jgi:hypothetical protein